MITELLLDVDTGVDDALAILFALRCPGWHVRAITCVSGNVGVEQVVANTLKVLDAASAPPLAVARGAAAPLSGRVEPPSRSVHGADGLADLGLPPSSRRPAPGPAAELLRRELLAAPEPPTLVACGPLTNVALLLRTAPGALARLRQLVVVGGTASGELGRPEDFNTAYDGEAAVAVLGSGVPVTMYTLDVFHQLALPGYEADRLAASEDPGTRLAGLLARHQARRFGPRGACLGDAGAVLAAAQPHGIRTRPHPTWPAVRVAVGIDVPAYRRRFLDAIRP